MNWCQSCGEQYRGTEHNCGWTRITNDRLRELEEAERELAELERLRRIEKVLTEFLRGQIKDRPR